MRYELLLLLFFERLGNSKIKVNNGFATIRFTRASIFVPCNNQKWYRSSEYESCMAKKQKLNHPEMRKLISSRKTKRHILSYVEILVSQPWHINQIKFRYILNCFELKNFDAITNWSLWSFFYLLYKFFPSCSLWSRLSSIFWEVQQKEGCGD